MALAVATVGVCLFLCAIAGEIEEEAEIQNYEEQRNAPRQHQRPNISVIIMNSYCFQSTLLFFNNN